MNLTHFATLPHPFKDSGKQSTRQAERKGQPSLGSGCPSLTAITAAACEGLTELEWRSLVAWMRDPKREPSHLAFTAGHARDAASAFEAART